MPQIPETENPKPEIQPDDTDYGPKAVTIKVDLEKGQAPPDSDDAKPSGTPLPSLPSPDSDETKHHAVISLHLSPGDETKRLVTSSPLPHADNSAKRLGTGSPRSSGNAESGFDNVRAKITALILSLFFAAFIGFGVLIVNLFPYLPGTAYLIAAAAVCLALLGITLVTIMALSRWVFTPLKKASQVFEALARGDLSQTIDTADANKFGHIMKALSQTQENIKEVMRSVGARADKLSFVGNEIQDILDDSLEVVNRVNASVRNLKDKSSSHAEGFLKAGTTMTGIRSDIKKLDLDIEQQFESVSQSSTSIGEMISNISSITANLTRNEEDLRRLREASSEGNSSLQKVSADIQEVAKESERLLEINRVIQNIASQTNLLAMNAAIEAAHAGEVGRGFAVVADEIRKLAESSSQQAKTVSVVLKNIKNALGNISSSTMASLSQFGDIEKGFESVSTQGMDIRKSMEQQDTSNKEVLSVLNASNNMAVNLRRRSSRIQSTSHEAELESKALENITREMAAAISEIAAGVENIKSAFSASVEVGQKSKNDIDSLMKEVGKFRL